MKLYKIKLTPTNRTLYIFIGVWDSEQAKKETGSDINISSEWQGAYITQEINKGYEPVMWIKNKNSKNTFIHECVHCVTDIMKITGINDDEFRAWYTEWLYNTIQDALKITKHDK